MGHVALNDSVRSQQLAGRFTVHAGQVTESLVDRSQPKLFGEYHRAAGQWTEALFEVLRMSKERVSGCTHFQPSRPIGATRMIEPFVEVLAPGAPAVIQVAGTE